MTTENLVGRYESDVLEILFYADGYYDETTAPFMTIENIEIADVVLFGESLDLDTLPKQMLRAFEKQSDDVEWENMGV